MPLDCCFITLVLLSVRVDLSHALIYIHCPLLPSDISPLHFDNPLDTIFSYYFVCTFDKCPSEIRTMSCSLTLVPIAQHDLTYFFNWTAELMSSCHFPPALQFLRISCCLAFAFFFFFVIEISIVLAYSTRRSSLKSKQFWMHCEVHRVIQFWKRMIGNH